MRKFRIAARPIESHGSRFVHVRLWAVRGSEETMCGAFQLTREEWTTYSQICTDWEIEVVYEEEPLRTHPV
jgi:hypothetical protein